MAKKAQKPNAKPVQKSNLNPLKVITEGLAFIGKPFYFLISRLTLAIIFLLYFVGHSLTSLAELKIKFTKFKKNKRTPITVKKVSPKTKRKNKLQEILKNIIPPNIKLPRLKIPGLKAIFQIEWLRVNLLELKIVGKIKKVFKVKISRFQKLQFKKRVSVIVLSLGFITLILISYFSIFRDLPSPRELTRREPEVSTKIFDRNGNLLYQIYKDQNRTIVPLESIPPHVRLATLAAEDAEFYSHPGFSVKGIFRAFITDIQTGSTSGGSTITQQLVKNTLLSPEKTITRKIKEVILSVEVEMTYTKDQILEMYLNEVSYGGTAYGIEEASRQYFGKDVENLDLAEAAFLAGLTKSPTLYSPFGQNSDLAFQRQREVLALMRINKFITESQENEAINEKLTFVPNKTAIEAPHFVMYVRQLLVDKYGEDMVEKGGLSVTTSLDLSIQKTAEQITESNVDKLKGLNVGNGAAMVINPQTGEILAMVGSKNYFDSNYDGQVNVTTSLRQPGSSIKVVNYAYALSHGFTPATIIDDSKITYVTPGASPYSPVNYDGKFVGPVTLRSALAQSRNIPAVKVLASYGVANMVAEGRDMGITTWDDPKNFGLSLTLGGGAVKMTDMTKVFSTLANNGKRPDLMPILTVKDYKGTILENNQPKTTQVLDPRVSFLLTDILKDNIARAPEFGLNSYLVVKDHPEVAVKTGTSNDLRDNWTIGYNQNYLVATWVGNNDNSEMSHIASGVTGASPIWNEIMSAILNGKDSIDWKIPDGVIKVNCPGGRSEWFLSENVLPNLCHPPTPAPSPTDQSKILNTGAKVIYP